MTHQWLWATHGGLRLRVFFVKALPRLAATHGSRFVCADDTVCVSFKILENGSGCNLLM